MDEMYVRLLPMSQILKKIRHDFAMLTKLDMDPEDIRGLLIALAIVAVIFAAGMGAHHLR
jgi:hypothetical protein